MKDLQGRSVSASSNKKLRMLLKDDKDKFKNEVKNDIPLRLKLAIKIIKA